MRDDDIRPHFPKQPGHLFQRPLVIEDKKIMLFEAVVGGADESGRFRPLSPPNATNLFGALDCRSAIARRHAGDMDLPTLFAHQPNQGAAAQELGIVGMRQDGKQHICHNVISDH